MIIDFEKLDKSPQLISVERMKVLLNRSSPTVSRFVNQYKVERVYDGKMSYIVKDSLIKALEKAGAKSKELLKTE